MAQACLLALGCTTGVAIAFFLAARLGLALLAEEVAVFWPASGIAVGILVVWGRRARAAVVVGVIAASIIANLMGDRSLWTSVVMGFSNAGEAILTAWLIERWFGPAFAFDDVRHVLGFVAAAALGVAASAFGGAATMTLLHTAAPYWDIWRAWLLSGGVGIVVVAPLVIGLGQLWHERPSPGEWIEGVGVLALLSVTSLYVVSHPASSWVSFSPSALVLPFLLWLTARCPPSFAMAGASIASAAVLFAVTFGIGRFGDASVAVAERVKGAQAAMTVVTLYTLILTALFAERRRNEAAVNESERRLRDLLGALPAAVYVTDAAGHITYCNQSAIDLWAAEPALGKDKWSDFSKFYYADGSPMPLADCPTELALKQGRVAPASEAIIERKDGTRISIAPYPTPLRDGTGAIVGVVNMTIDISERKKADDHQRMLTAELDHRVKNVLATVSAVAGRTLGTTSSMDEFVAALDGRIRSMATTHELLSGRQWKGIPLADLLRHQLAPYTTKNNVDVEGPEVLLSAGAGQTIGMVLHELTTNAAKYGALSTHHGRILVRWHWPLNGKVPDRLIIEWREVGGPAVQAPDRSGHGMEVIRDLIPYELKGTVDIVFAPGGVSCRIDIPVPCDRMGDEFNVSKASVLAS